MKCCSSQHFPRLEILKFYFSCGIAAAIVLLLRFNNKKMTDEEHSDSRTEDDYEAEEAYDDEGNNYGLKFEKV